ncbi:MAG: thioesterase [Anaerolineae bacterium]
MPAIYKRTFRVRSYETDSYGHVNQVNYLRYMQESALDASAEVGYDGAAYDALGTLWLIHDTEIEYFHSLRYGDSVEVTTYVGDFRRVRSRRFYEMHLVGSGELVAKGSTDWIYLDRATQRPQAIPPEMVRAFAPEGIDALPPGERRDKFPEPPPPPPGAFTMRRVVEWRDVDSVEHVNNAVYLSYMEESAIEQSASIHWPMQRMRDEGFGVVARKHQIEYRLQAELGDPLLVTTFLSEPRRSSIIRNFIIARPDGEVVARSRSLYLCVNLSTGMPMRIPQQVMEDFADVIADGTSVE